MKLTHEENRSLYFDLSKKEAADLICKLTKLLAKSDFIPAELTVEENTALKQKRYVFCINHDD